VKTEVVKISENVNLSAVSPSSDAEILEQLKETFQDSVTSESLKVTILSVLPKSWSIWKVQESF
jgi:hypothetical protein